MSRRSLLLRSVIPAAIFALGASLYGAAPQYQIDAAFQAPVFTAKGYGSKVYVMPHDATFVFSHSSGFNLINGQPILSRGLTALIKPRWPRPRADSCP